MQHRLYGLRGEAYTQEYKRLYAELAPEIKAEVLKLKASSGSFTIYDFGRLCVEFEIPATVMDDYLNSIFPPTSSDFFWGSGTWGRLHSSGVKAKDIGIAWGD